MTTEQQLLLSVGAPIAIRHLGEIEVGTLLSHTHPEHASRYGEDVIVKVRFADGTISTWPYCQVAVNATIDARGGSL